MDSFRDDFWTNGEFQNLYSSNDTYDQYNSWHRYDSNSDLNWYHSEGMFGTLFQNTAIADLNEASSYSSDVYLEEQRPNYVQSNDGLYSPYDQPQITDNNNNFAENSPQTFLTDMDDWKQQNLNEMMCQADNSDNKNNAWDNIEDLLNESTCDMMNYNGDLPAQTLYCNDSCKNFLAETTENLQIYRPLYEPNPNQCSIVADNSNGGIVPIRQEQRNITPNEDKEFVCTYGDCRKIYAKAGHLKAHIRRHVGDKPYICLWPNCTWRFSRSDELSRHRRSHSGIKPYKCSYCPKCFSRSDHLTKHRKVHERKMAAMKIKAVWNQLPPRKPGRKPKSAVTQEAM